MIFGKAVKRHGKYGNNMKILLTGGGTGGHFYPLIAVADTINKVVNS